MSIQTPDWVKHAVFYQIYPDRFARTTRPALPPEMQVPLESWDSLPTPQGYKGGDLWGIAEQLDYLQNLGITAIYFTPIFSSASNHRYHTHDYYKIDPLLGGRAAFDHLLKAAHERDIKVVLDGVFNHASRGFLYFNDILENGPHSPWLNWFSIEGWPLSAYDGEKLANYKSWINNRALPEFNYENAQAREYIMRVGEYWIAQGIDGWRLDVPFEIKTEGFWAEFRTRIKAINPEAYIVGEVWTDAREWLAGDQFDGVMNYLFTGPAIAFAAQDRVDMSLVKSVGYFPYPALDAKGYAEKIEALFNLYDWEIHQTQLNLLSSHDIARILSVVGEDIASVELATLLLLTFPGAPSIYYGDEVGLAGGLDPDCRRTFPPPSDWNQSLLATHKSLIALRHQYPALRIGTYQTLAAEGDCYVFARVLAEEMVVIAVNTGTASVQVRLADMAVTQGQVLYGVGHVDWLGDRTAMLDIPARAGIVLGTP
ncbi:MAG: glycoside hydrolase family 13 protein [Phormidesmis sp. RL_2_1]|nr:glycoside hydrolase family 13 protein [Phormidesmis sp. RL_2_1]